MSVSTKGSSSPLSPSNASTSSPMQSEGSNTQERLQQVLERLENLQHTKNQLEINTATLEEGITTLETKVKEQHNSILHLQEEVAVKKRQLFSLDAQRQIEDKMEDVPRILKLSVMISLMLLVVTLAQCL